MQEHLDDVTPTFLDDIKGNQMVKALVKADGLAMYNRLYRSTHDQKRTEKFYEEVFKKSFDGPQRLDVGGNWILLGK